jgi:uncharacterized protein YecE (DUF72 family)
MPEWRLGTVGFGYADWQGVFYPQGMKSSDHLSFYSKLFDTVELDTTFHAAPTAERVRRWAEATPDGFRFCVKTPKDITHAPGIERRIGQMAQFVETVREFGEKLGPVLLQFPPAFDTTEAPELRRFLNALPRDVRIAVELRHRSWDADPTADLLRDCGAGWVAADYLEAPWSLTATTDSLYVRWIGEHGQFPTLDRERIDVTERLRWWKDRIEKLKGVATVWGFMNNDYSGFAIATCNRMKRLVGQPVREPEDPAQGQLFR